MSSDAVIQSINEFDPEALRQPLSEWPEASPENVQRAILWIRSLQADLIGMLESISDPDDVGYTLAIRYIELKSRWIALNTKINYETFKHGACDQREAFCATCVSTLLAHIEPLLEQKDINTITDFLADPMQKAA